MVIELDNNLTLAICQAHYIIFPRVPHYKDVLFLFLFQAFLWISIEKLWITSNKWGQTHIFLYIFVYISYKNASILHVTSHNNYPNYEEHFRVSYFDFLSIY